MTMYCISILKSQSLLTCILIVVKGVSTRLELNKKLMIKTKNKVFPQVNLDMPHWLYKYMLIGTQNSLGSFLQHHRKFKEKPPPSFDHGGKFSILYN